VLLAFGYFVVKFFDLLPGADVRRIRFKLLEKPVAFSFEPIAFFGPIDWRLCHEIHLVQVCAIKRNLAPLADQSGLPRVSARRPQRCANLKIRHYNGLRYWAAACSIREATSLGWEM
jgi:hypothetical protein